MSNRTIETFRNWLGSKEATAQLAYLRERCEHGVSGECGRCKDDAAFRLACFTLRQFGADLADPHIHEAIVRVLARVDQG